MKTSSCGFDALTRAIADASTLARLVRMLPLLSTISPIDTGTSSRRTVLMGCSTLFSKTWNALCCRLVMNFPLLSTTVACRTTRRVSARNVVCACSSGWETLDWAERGTTASATRAPARVPLLNWSIVALSVGFPQGRQTLRLHQLDLYLAILSVPLDVGRRVAENILVAQLDSNLCRHIGQFVQVFHSEMPASGLVRKIVQQPRSAKFFGCPVAGSAGLENPDGIDLDVRFPNQVLNFALCI